MRLVKFCCAEHNPARSSPTIQIGSLSYYRKINHDFVRDEREGVISRALETEGPITLTPSEFSRVSGISSPNDFGFGGNAIVQLGPKSLSISNSLPDAYIFCAHIAEDEVPERLLGYEDRYEITRPADFNTALRSEIAKAVPGAKVVHFSE